MVERISLEILFNGTLILDLKEKLLKEYLDRNEILFYDGNGTYDLWSKAELKRW